MNRRLFLLYGTTTACAALGGCVTPALFKDKEYNEKITSFMISADGKKLVVLGEQYHYIFDMPEKLLPVLKSDYRTHLNSSFDGFHVDGSVVTGYYSLRLRDNAPTEERQQATADGFKSILHGELYFSGDIQGTRYSAADFEQKLTAQSFNQDYLVHVTETLSPLDKGVRMLATPITVAADGALLLGGVLLIPFALVQLNRHGITLF